MTVTAPTAVAEVSRAAKERIVAQYQQRSHKSARLHADASRVLPGGVNRNIVHFEPHPLFVKRGEGPYLFDEDDNRYLDCIANYTSMAVGHAHPEVTAAVIEQVRRGSAWAAASAGEAELASMIAERMPSMEQVRFTASGTEATLMAVRAARAFTGRPLIAKFEGGYHGLHDYAMVSMAPPLEFAGSAGSPAAYAPAGIPDAVRDSVLVLPFNDLAATRRILEPRASEVAAILVEPVPGVAGVLLPRPGFLQGLRDLADELGCLLIFDEVISFRLSYGGAQEVFGVRPHLTTLGKIIGGGYPVGAVGGSAEVMQVFAPSSTGAKVVLSGTFHANPVVLAAGKVTLRLFSRDAITALNGRAGRFYGALQQLIERRRLPLRVNSIGSLFNLHAARGPVENYRDAYRVDRELLKYLYLALLNHGVMVAPRGMGVLSAVMTDEHVQALLSAFDKSFADLASA